MSASYGRRSIILSISIRVPTIAPALPHRTSIAAGNGFGVMRWGDKGTNARKLLWFPELAQHGVNRVECGVDLFSDLRRPTRITRSVKASYVVASCPSASNNYLCTREDNLARDKDEQDDLGLDHTVDETRE